MAQYSDRDIAALRTIAERIDRSTPESSECIGNQLLERDRLRRRVRRIAGFVLLMATAVIGAYALMAGSAWWPLVNGQFTRSDLPSAPAEFTIVRAVIAEYVNADGQPHNVTTSFYGRTPVAVLFEVKGGRPDRDVIVTTISGADFERSCDPMVVTHSDGTYWCQWETIDPGEYNIAIRLNGTVSYELPLTIADPAIRSPGPDVQSSFDCVQPQTPVEKAICQHDALARLETRMDALYRSALVRTDSSGRSRLKQRQDTFIAARRLKCAQATASELVACVVSAAEVRLRELEANQLPSFPPSTPLLNARKQLIALGWKPVTLSTGTPCRAGDANCQGTVEMVVCSGGPPPTCRHTWMRNGTIIEITSLSHDDARVISVVCRAGCQ